MRTYCKHLERVKFHNYRPTIVAVSFVKMDDLRPLSYGIITVLFFLAVVTICMRIYVRWYTMNAFSWDDRTMGAMLLFNSCQQAILYFFLQYGGGLHITDIMASHPEWLPLLLKGLLVEEFWYIWMQFIVKMCFLLFYFRLSEVPWYRRALWSVIIFHAATTLVIWLLYAFQCMPLAAFYEPLSYPDVECLSTDVTYFVPYTLNMTTDVCILILPLPVILCLQMSLKRRLAILAVITTGGSAVLVSGLRAIILFEFAASPDFTWALGKMVIISSIEMQVAIIAANMPSLKAFYTCWRMHKLGRGEGVDLAYHQSQSKNSKQTDDMEMGDSSNRISRTTKHARNLQGELVLPQTESEERLYRLFDPKQ